MNRHAMSKVRITGASTNGVLISSVAGDEYHEQNGHAESDGVATRISRRHRTVPISDGTFLFP